MAGIAHIMACCSEWFCPCTTGGSPIGFQAVVTVAPPATCHANCYLAERTHNGPLRDTSSSEAGGETVCVYWVKDASGYHIVTLLYNRDRHKWYANQRGLVGGNYYYFGGNEAVFPGDSLVSKDVTAYITCDPETREISGTFDLDGRAQSGAWDCSGCTATVTVSKYW